MKDNNLDSSAAVLDPTSDEDSLDGSSNQRTPSSKARQDELDSRTPDRSGNSAGSGKDAGRTQRQLRSRIPDGFVPVDCKRDLKSSAGDSNSNLWLVQVPEGFDVTTLNGALHREVLTTSGSQRLKIKEEGHKKLYNVQTFMDTEECKKLGTVVFDSKADKVCLGRSVQHMMMITEAVKLPHLPVDTSQVPEKRVPMPQGLKVRFRPFGADQPRVNQTTGARHKKKKKHTSSSDEMISPRKKLKSHAVDVTFKQEKLFTPQTHATLTSSLTDADHTPRLSSSKHERKHATDSFQTSDTGLDCVKNESNHDPGAEVTPSKHRKSKKRKRESGVNGAAESESHESSTSPRKKLKKEMHDDDSFFTIDRKGDSLNVTVMDGPSDDFSSPHKKKKSKKERRRTVM
ncbi:hypothetical protein BaRGS_00020179 [Batillaria attramentaria]|uniref:DNA-directed RNA polymerase I subunit RPA34 n=1 Tax=Batillaria attramentaria TaxID=370345 RepID=A0ABD0KNR3_9CAEN